MGFMGMNEAFKCKNCGAKICKVCVRYHQWGGLLGDKHLSVVCPICESVTRVR